MDLIEKIIKWTLICLGVVVLIFYIISKTEGDKPDDGENNKGETEEKVLESNDTKPSPNDTIWIDENQPISIRTGNSTVRKIFGGFIDLSPGENIVEIPNRLGIDLTDPRNEDVEFEVFFPGKGWVKKAQGELLKLPSTKTIRIRVDSETQIWSHYFYRVKNANFVKAEYRL